MKIEWDAPYFNRCYWILDHLQEFHLDANEMIVVLVIQYLSDAHLELNDEIIAQKAHIDVDEVEKIYRSLDEKGYLSLGVKNGQVVFNLEGLMQDYQSKSAPLKKSLLQEFEMEFGRPLSSTEMSQILDMASTYDERRVIVALNEAASYDQRNLGYIRNILASWQRKNLSIEDLENGRR